MPRWVNTGEDITPLPVPESKVELPGLPESASATAVAMRFFGLRKRAAEEASQGRPPKPEHVMPEQAQAHLTNLPEQAAEQATAALARRQLAGLGVIDTDLCLWAESLTPDQQNALYLVPALPTVKMKTAVYPQPYGAMAPVGTDGGFVCSINRWVASHPWLAGGALLAGALLLGGTGKRSGTRVRRRTTTAAPRRAA